ncbi:MULTISPECIES: transporter substrate-binding domain-containing protein [unclassified Moraxella]|uniref:transporter substrate-binding domain-containing protein n=1 Tax=unclassified Moraxella TaxID=2685852 RepID=UPI003AF82B45
MKNKLFITLLLSSLALVGCDKQPQSQATAPPTTDTATPSKLPADAQTYVVGVDANYAPFALNDEKGNVIGFDKDILDAIGENQGFRVNAVGSIWDNIFTNLNVNKFDLVGSAVTITPERQTTMDFSKPYIESYIAIAYKNPAITSFVQLKTKKIAVQKGAYSIDILKKNGINPENMIEFKTGFLAYQAMLTGKTDAVCDDVNVIDYSTKQLKSLADTSQVKHIRPPVTETDLVGFAIKKGRKDLVDKVNKGLDNIKQNGMYDKIYAKWFGNNAVIISASSSASTAKN